MAKLIEKELKEIVRIIAGIERASEENDPALDKQTSAIQEIFDLFTKKYPKLKLKIEKRIDAVLVKIFITEPSVKKVFDEAASKLKGLTGIGINSFDEATIKDADKFASIVNKIANSLFLTYTLDFGTETIVLEFNKKENIVELNYEIKSLVNPLTPQSRLLQEYAGKESDKSVNFLDKCYQLGFVDIEDEALFEWEDEFYPKMLDI